MKHKKIPSIKSVHKKNRERERSSRKRAKYTLHNAHTIFSEKKSLMKIYDFVNVYYSVAPEKEERMKERKKHTE